VSKSQNNFEVVVIGAGPAGLACGAMLRRRGVQPVLLEQSEQVAATWRRAYDRLHLHTVRWMSDLPGHPMPRRHGRWPSRDSFVSYLERYADVHALDVRHGRQVEAIRRGDGGWEVATADGPIAARAVVVATGLNRKPFVPDWPGIESFEGELFHSSEYRNPRPYLGQSVLVVGSGNSGAEIATDLAEGGARVRLSMRTSPHVIPREMFGMPGQLSGMLVRQLPRRLADAYSGAFERLAFGDLSKYGVSPPARGAYTQVVRDGVVPIVDVGFVDTLKAGGIEPVAGVTGFSDGEVQLEGGAPVRADAVIAATGYSSGLAELVGSLGVLDERERPKSCGGRSPAGAEGLFFVGFTQPVTGNLFEIRSEAKQVAAAVTSLLGERAGAV
jgi:cation diffusion facilitator CzcD-associated flavoprotein CzcO